MNTSSNLEIINAFFTAYAARDIPSIREVLAPDIVWRIPGHHPLAGEKRGIEEVVAFFDQLGRAGFRAQPIVVVAKGDYVLDHHRGWSDAAGGLDMTWCLVFRFEAGQIKEVTNFAADQHRADLFFWSLYPLKPIPERLA
jgi:ketosteroid isomerase-like protein